MVIINSVSRSLLNGQHIFFFRNQLFYRCCLGNAVVFLLTAQIIASLAASTCPKEYYANESKEIECVGLLEDKRRCDFC